MFLINKAGREVDVPYEMEERGYKQAQKVLSISSELMDKGIVQVGQGQYTVKTRGMGNLRDKIMSEFPDVVTDEEYLANKGKKKEEPEPEPEEKEEPEEKVVKKEPREDEVKQRFTEKVKESQEQVEKDKENVKEEKEEEDDGIERLTLTAEGKPDMDIDETMLTVDILEALDFYGLHLTQREARVAKSKIIKKARARQQEQRAKSLRYTK